MDIVKIAVLFPAWLVYYLFGLEWERWRAKLRGGTVKILAHFPTAP